MAWLPSFLRRFFSNRRSVVRSAVRSEFVVRCGSSPSSLVVEVDADAASGQDFCLAYSGQSLHVIAERPIVGGESALRIWLGAARSRVSPSSLVLKTQPYVDMVAPIPASYDTYLSSSIGKILRADIKKARGQGWGLEETRELSHYESFYRQVFVPYTVKVHGPQGHIPSLDQFLKQGKKLSLLRVMKAGVTLGGTFLLSSSGHRQLRNWRIGIAPECWEDQKLSTLVAIALNSRVVERAIQQNFREASFGLSPAVLNHGNTFMKLKWGCSPRPADGPFYFAEIVGQSGRDFLGCKPLIHFRGNEVIGIVALESSASVTPSAISEMINRLASSGLAEVLVWVNSEGAALVDELRRWPHWSNVCCPVRFENRLEDLRL